LPNNLKEGTMRGETDAANSEKITSQSCARGGRRRNKARSQLKQDGTDHKAKNTCFP